MALPTEILPDNGEELITLTRMLRRSRGKFALAFARCNSPAGRQVLVERLRVTLDAAEISFQEVTLNTTENIVSQLQAVPGQDEGQPVFIYGIEALLPSDREHHATLTQLNERREKFQKLARPLIFWLPEFALQEIATKASDFWAWRSGVYHFEVEAEMRLEDFRVATGEDVWRDSNLSLEEKNARLSLLLALVQDYSEDDLTSVTLAARAKIYYRIGHLRQSLGNLDDAIIYYQRSLEIRETLKDLLGKAVNLNAIASIFKIRGDLEKAMQLYHEAMKISQELNNPTAKAAALKGIAQIYVMHGDLDNAMQFYQDVLEIEENSDRLLSKATTLDAIGKIFFLRGELDHAMKLYEEALEINQRLGNLLNTGAVLNQMANLLQAQNKFEQAEIFYKQSLEIVEKLGNPLGKSAILNNLAQIHIERGDLERAMQFSKDSLKIRENLGDLAGKSTALRTMADIFVRRSELDKATKLYEEALEITTNLGNLSGKAGTLAMLSQVKAMQGNYKEALSELIEARDITIQIGANVRTQTQENNVAILKSMTGHDAFSALWTEVTGEETLPEWLQETK